MTEHCEQGSEPTHSEVDATLWHSEGIIEVRQQRHLEDPFAAIEEKVAAGTLIRLSRSCFAQAHRFRALPPAEQHLMRMRAVASDFRSKVFVGPSAAVAHGLWMFAPAAARVFLHRPGGSAPSSAGARGDLQLVHTPVTTEETVLCQGLPVTSVERTILDLFLLKGPGSAYVAACSALRKRLSSTERMMQAASDESWRRHRARFEEVISHAHAEASSAAEAIFEAFLLFGVTPTLSPNVQQLRAGEEILRAFLLPGTDEALFFDDALGVDLSDAMSSAVAEFSKESGRMLHCFPASAATDGTALAFCLQLTGARPIPRAEQLFC